MTAVTATIGALVLPLALGAERLPVAATVLPQAYLLKRLGGDAVSVQVLVPAGAGGEAEHFAPAPSQLRALEGCRLYFKVGHRGFTLESVHVESFLAANREVRQVALAATPTDGLTEDPHLWLSPRLMARAAEELARELIELLPGERATIAERARVLGEEIAALDAELTRRFAGRTGQHFFVNHPSLGYFARDYGLVQQALESHGREPTAQHLRRLARELRAAGVRAILVQEGFSRAGAEALARDGGARLVSFDPLAADWLAASRRLGEAVTAALERGPRP